MHVERRRTIKIRDPGRAVICRAVRRRHLDHRIRRLADLWHAFRDFIRPDFKLSRVFWPNVVAMATSAASRPRAISTRPILGTLFRGSNVVPGATEIDFKPRCKVRHAIRRRRAHVAKVPGAVARRNIHAAAERDS